MINKVVNSLDDGKCLVVIPARGGSKGVKKKNIKYLHGKPLIQYTVDVAREVFRDEYIYISTDSLEIKKVCEDIIGISVPFLRPKELATDTAGSREVLLHALDFYYKEFKSDPDVLILLQPTSPLRKASHIKEALELWEDNLDMIVSVKETESNPYYVLFEEDKGFLKKSKEGDFTRRQDCPPVWELNGAIYMINVKKFRNHSVSEFSRIKKYVMDNLSSVDIDTELDFLVAESILNSHSKK